ncbi:MAG: hypothetical protein KI790_02050 [Cyclobacteriaceae bacterium]|nr:hypothetical protein [Cyclobacteriaceae bacterium HetDA_MAG_MS6]
MKENLIFKVIALVWAYVLLFSCAKKDTPGLPIHYVGESFKEIELNHWKVVGPFKYDTIQISGKDYIDINDIQALNDNEHLSIEDWKELDSASNFVENQIAEQFAVKTISPEDHTLDFVKEYDIKGIAGISSAYAACILHSDIKQKLVLGTSIYNTGEVWLNNRKVVKLQRKVSSKRKYEEYVPITLNKGENLLVLKANPLRLFRSDSSEVKIFRWKLLCDLFSPQHAERIFYRENKYNILINPIVELNSGPILNTEAIVESTHLYYEYVDEYDNVILKDTVHVSSDKTSLGSINTKGIYSLNIEWNGYSMSQDFLVGSFEEEFSDRLISLESGIKDYEFQVYKNRFQHLMNFQIPPYLSEKKFYDRNKVALIKSLSVLDRGVLSNSGFRLHSYISSIDSTTIESYYLYWPKVNDVSKSVPLVIELPYEATPPLKPLFSSFYLSNVNHFSFIEHFADSLQVAVLFPYMRSYKPYDSLSTMDLTDSYLNVLNQYPVDEELVFGVGGCSATTKLLIELLDQTKIEFKGVLLHTTTYYEELIDDFDDLPDIEYFIQHPVKDAKIPVGYSDYLANKLKELNKSVVYERTNSAGHAIQFGDYYRDGYQFFAEIIEGNQTN